MIQKMPGEWTGGRIASAPFPTLPVRERGGRVIISVPLGERLTNPI